MRPETILLILVVLACPLAMLVFHRGGHGGHQHASDAVSLTELRRMRASIDRELAARQRPPVPAAKEEPRADA